MAVAQSQRTTEGKRVVGHIDQRGWRDAERQPTEQPSTTFRSRHNIEAKRYERNNSGILGNDRIAKQEPREYSPPLVNLAAPNAKEDDIRGEYETGGELVTK